MSIRVMLADDHPVVRAGIKTMLEMELVGGTLRLTSEPGQGTRQRGARYT